MAILEADRGYDSGWLRQASPIKKIFPLISYRKIKREIVLSKEEIFALDRYRLALDALIQNFPSETICELLDRYAKYAGFYPGSTLFTEDVQHRISYHKKMIRQNYQSSLYLLNKMNSSEFLDILDSCF
jgi:hypothetical protein